MASIDLTFYYTLLPSISIFSISQYLITLFFTLFHSPQFSFYIFYLSVSILHFISIYFILFYSLSILTISQFLPLTLNLSLSVSLIFCQFLYVYLLLFFPLTSHILFSTFQAIEVVVFMRKKGLVPDEVTYNTLLKLCVRGNDMKGANEVRDSIFFSFDNYSYNASTVDYILSIFFKFRQFFL